MANGDAAAAAGFTVVASTDDIRLGYDAINRAADLAVARGMRSYASKAALDLVPGLFAGAIAMVGDIAYRWTNVNNAFKWMIWDYRSIPFDTFAAVANGAVVNSAAAGMTSMDIIGGEAILHFALYKSAGTGTGQPYMILNAGYRPGGIVNFGGMTEGNAAFPAALQVDSNGGVLLISNGGQPATGYRGTAVFKIVN